MKMCVNIMVIGAGVVGLSTAVNIQRTILGARITIAADKLYDDTASYGTGGLFIPAFSQGLAKNDVQFLKKWITTSWKFYCNLASSSEARESGVTFISGYDLIDELSSEEDLLYKDVVLNCVEMSDGEKQTLGFQNFKHVFKVTTVVIYMVKYLKWLRKRFEENGGKIVRRHVSSFDELIGQYDMVVNCSGYGSRLLADDTKVVPVSGHLVRVHAPWIKHFILSANTYIIPGEELVNLGVINQTDNTDRAVNPEHTARILHNCEQMCPNLKGAKFDHDWTGIRPVRETIRLEIEMFQSGTKHIPVLHNYGHGYHGIGLSWGTAIHAVEIINNFMSINKSRL